jgi:hypothetical protein
VVALVSCNPAGIQDDISSVSYPHALHGITGDIGCLQLNPAAVEKAQHSHRG